MIDSAGRIKVPSQHTRAVQHDPSRVVDLWSAALVAAGGDATTAVALMVLRHAATHLTHGREEEDAIMAVKDTGNG